MRLRSKRPSRSVGTVSVLPVDSERIFTTTWGAGSAPRFRYTVPKISPESLPEGGLGGSSKEAPCARAEGVSVSNAGVKKENKRKKEPVRRFNFQTCPIMFRRLDLGGRLESPFCDWVPKNANAIS